MKYSALLCVFVSVLLLSSCVDVSSSKKISVVDPLPHVVTELLSSMKSWIDDTVDPCQDFFQYACGTWVKNNPVPANISEDVPYMNVPDIMDIEAHIQDWTAEVVTQPWPIGNDVYLSCMQSSNSLAKDLMNVYLSYVKAIELTEFAIFEEPAQAAKDAEAVLLLVEGPIAEYVNIQNHLQNISIEQLEAATKLNWTVFFGDLLQEGEFVNSPVNLTLLVNYLLTPVVPDYIFRRFFQWQYYKTFSQFNISQCVDLTWAEAQNNSFCRMFANNVKQYDQQHLCSYIVYHGVQDIVDMIFAAEIVNPELAYDVHTMTDDIHTAFFNSLTNIDWITQNQTNIDVVDFKLKHVIQNIGHSNVMDKYSGVVTTPTSFTRNMVAILVERKHFSVSMWRRPYNRTEEYFGAEVVNAFYDPNQNTINFPAGILESPMYSFTWPALWQYARMGYVVGHESTHGFDNDGSHFDAFGWKNDIFDDKTRRLFDQRAQCVADYYSKFIAYGNTSMNGEQTLGENIADIGGLKNAYRAYQLYVAREGPEFVDGELLNMTVDQIFFTAFGQTWCAVENEAALKKQYILDVHSPFKYRVNGPLAQFDQFAKAFKCAANTPLNPPNRCALW